ncbi:hypothetical protein [Tautonia rosea]|uniref:hypothetical protein n=1 Tax=Tautonia rosea TaxID=2728037 RepID=UPI00147522C3|nr:hypothetical protein [Tautonia rosea]
MIPPRLRSLAYAMTTLVLIPGTASGQFGGMGGGGMGGLMMGQEPPELSERMVEVEALTGKRVSGPLRLGPIAIDSDFGGYEIPPEKLKIVRFDIPEGHPPMNMYVMPNGGWTVSVPGAVVAASGEELAGSLQLYGPLKMTTNLGPLTLDPSKLRSITFLPDAPENGDAEDDVHEDEDMENDVEDAEPKSPSDTPSAATGPGSTVRSTEPALIKINEYLWAISPSGDRVAVRNTHSGQTARVDLPASADLPLSITPINNAYLTALQLEGPEIRRVAVFNTTNNTWYALDLSEPVSDKASPIVNPETAVYHLGRFVYAFSMQSNRWASLELSDPTSASPVLEAGAVTVRDGSRIHTFRSDRGTWTTVDSQDLLNDLLNDEGASPPPEAGDATKPTP